MSHAKDPETAPTEERTRYPFREMEQRARALWRDEHLFEIGDPMKADRRFYCLNMFPYPSGDLHVGHGRNYILGDVVTRLKIMQGHHVLTPMGWDAFGLPAENAAIANKIHPAVWTKRNIARMKEQLTSWGLGYDWSREIASCDPSYYRWTQWIFLQLYKKGLAYRAKSAVNWCPKDQTVLANEQVVEGRCERCGSEVTTRELEQWFFKITAYAEPLLNDLETLTDWPEKVRVMQHNWIGRSEGASIRFTLRGGGEPIEVFTTRPDTLYGATFVVLAAEHPRVRELERTGTLPPAAAEFVARIRQHRIENRFAVETEKEGYPVGLEAVHPLTGAALPVWVANYVLMEYGTGAIMAVPGHDQRDFEFAKKYGLPIAEVIRPDSGPGYDGTAAWEGDGRLVNSGPIDGQSSAEAKRAVIADLEKRKGGEARVQYRLRDWLISRQRYWGAPIPIVRCPACGIQPVPESELPVLLPDQVEFSPTGESPLLTNQAFLNTSCPKCGGQAKRETDTMDTFVDSSWYFLRFLSPNLETAPFSKDAVDRWLPVGQYIGGVEHAILHLLYSRFIVKVLRDMGHLGFSEPFARLFTQGMITKDGHKMSKSKGNVVAPDALIERFGTDTVRLYTLFIGPPAKDAEWNDRGVEGAYRYLIRYWKMIEDFVQADKVTDVAFAPSGARRDLRRRVHEIAARVIDDLDRLHLNTAVSGLMQLVNAVQDYQTAGGSLSTPEVAEAVDMATRLLAPLAPHTAEGAWAKLGRSGTVFRSGMPAISAEALKQDLVRYVVSVNGKVRSNIEVPADSVEDAIRETALADASVRKHVEGKTVAQVIVVKGRLVNVVAR